METETKKIKQFLKKNIGKPFTSLGIFDESDGTYLQDDKVVNSFLVRFIKTNIAQNITTSEIGKYLYNKCNDILHAHDFWTTKRKRVAFWYSWKDQI